MSKSKWEKAAEDLNRRLEEEKTAHTRTRNELQVRIERIWRLVPSHHINLMGVYPALRRLLHVLAEAADLQDPSKGAATEDTMRTEYTPDGESLTQTERGLFHHQRARSNVKTLQKDLDKLVSRIHRLLDDQTHHMGALVPGSHWEYDPPKLPVCRREGCSERNKPQSAKAYEEGCGGCGREFEMEFVSG